eukprot:COSAG05_NODE_2899_length_2527_cov_2.510297_2_plen_71_part_00
MNDLLKNGLERKGHTLCVCCEPPIGSICSRYVTPRTSSSLDLSTFQGFSAGFFEIFYNSLSHDIKCVLRE